jgi:hypothetical protein
MERILSIAWAIQRFLTRALGFPAVMLVKLMSLFWVAKDK